MKTKRELLSKVMGRGLKPLPKISVSEWADKYRRLPSDSAEPGRWRTSRTPYTKSIMDSFTQANVHRIVVKSAAQVGKALALETPIATVDGWTTMAEIKVGDKVFDEQGKVCNVVAVSEVMKNRPCYEITFSDGAKVIADANHNWAVQEDLHYRMKEKILTTEELLRNYKVKTNWHPLNRYALPIAKPLNLPAQDLPIEPYLLGYWLGDGASERARLTVGDFDAESIQRIITANNYEYNIYSDRRETHRVVYVNIGKSKVDGVTFGHKLVELNLLNNKHIPPQYLRGSYEQRLELLRGLMDSDGHVDKLGQCTFIQKQPALTVAVAELINSLGLKCKISQRKNGIHIIYFYAYDNVRVFNLQRKFERQKPFDEGCQRKTLRRRITNIKPVDSVPVKCIQVDSASHMYLCGREMIPTKNSEILNNVIGRFSHTDPCTMLMIQPTLELAQDFSKSRISKMIQDTKVLTPLFADADKTRNTNQTILSKFFVGGRLVLAGANSSAGLASRPIRILLCDEVDRYPQSAGNEGDPVSLAAKRTTTFWNYKIGLFSTPTNEGASRIDIEYLAGTQEEWQHRCPNCKEYHILDFRQMKTEHETYKDDFGNKTVIVKKVMWQCPDCGFEFNELQMKKSAQKYVSQNPEALANGIRSFWLNGFSSPWLSWADIMREWYEARGKPELEAVVYNTRFGLSYRQTGEFSDENEFLERREKYDAQVPSAVKILTAAVDVQDNRLEVEICGFSLGNECWGILKRVVLGVPNLASTWAELDAILDRDYKLADGTTLKVFRTFIDSGGHFTSYVYEYCQRNLRKGRFAIKGMGGDGLKLIHKITKAANAAVLLVMLGVNEGKQQVMNRLAIKSPGEYYFHFPLEDKAFEVPRGYDAVYFKGLISERRRVTSHNGLIKVIWEPVDRSTRNENLDLRVYNLAAFASCQVDWSKQSETEITVAKDSKVSEVAKVAKVDAPRKITSTEMSLWT